MEMPYDPLEERKQNRDKVKQARLQRQKTLLIRLAIAGGVLVACAVLILIVIFSGGKEQPEQTQPSTLQTTAPDSTAGTQTGDTQPDPAGVAGFAAYLTRYKESLAAEKAAAQLN